jgi:O-antigen ligase
MLLGIVCVLLLALLVAARRPWLVSDPRYLGGILFLEIIAFCIWRYEVRFFPFLVLVFLWAGTAVPLKYVASTARWVVLAAAAAVGCVVWVKGKRHGLGKFHLAAFTCVVAGLASSLVSSVPVVACLKVAGLAMIFIYASTGARAAFWNNPARFINTLILGCEAVVFLTTVAYLLLRLQLFGNPNSLGAVMGFIVPLLFWRVLVTPWPEVRYHRIAALCLAGGLLYMSVARAAILGATTTCLLLCFVLRRYRVFPKIILASILLVSLVAVLLPERFPELVSSFTGNLIYKQHAEAGIFGSRETPWSRAVDSIKQHPWFGSGFGTGSSLSRGDFGDSNLSSSTHKYEYGSSYLAIMDYTGLIGVAVFGVLILLLLWRTVATLVFVRQSGNYLYAAFPFAMIATVGLIHALFEDWLFAAGSYICVFFWPCAFLLMDFVPPRGSRTAAQAVISDLGHANTSANFGSRQHRGVSVATAPG